MTKIKVAIVRGKRELKNVSGVDRFILSLQNELKKNGEVESEIIYGNYFLPFFLKFFNFQKLDRFDIVHIGAPGWGIFTKTKRNILITFYDDIMFRPQVFTNLLPLLEKVKLLIIKKLWSLALIVDIKKSKKIVAISQESKKVIVNRFKISPEEITVIPPGVKTDIYKPIPSIRKRKNKNIFRLFYCGRLCLRKGTDLLLDSLVLLKEKYKIQNSKLYIAGTVDKNFNLKREVKKRHLERNVFFLGNLSDQELSLHYNLSDVFVFPSRIEGYGIPPLEALACGIKVVSTNIPSIKPFQEIIIVKTTAKSIAEGILRAIDKSIDFKLARRKIEKDYSVGVVSKKYIELYKELILK